MFYAFCYLALVLWLIVQTNSDGLNGCSCLTRDQIIGTGLYVDYAGGDTNGTLDYDGYSYPNDYGQDCKKHDSDPLPLQPYCTMNSPPAWCADEWCYVDCNSCSLPMNSRSAYFTNTYICYSYQTCGTVSTFESWLQNGSNVHTVSDLKAIVETYLIDIKETIESRYVSFDSWSPDEQAMCKDGVNCLCNCDTCEAEASWGENYIDFTKSGFTPTVAPAVDRSICMSDMIGDYFTRTAQKEYDDKNRIAYLYAALQDDGSYVQWPATEWCVVSYNPFLRAWYSAAAGGTNRAVIVVIDKSGSMKRNNRGSLAVNAAKQVVTSLTYFDQVQVIMFDSETRHVSEWTSTSDTNKITLSNWIDMHYEAQGGTNFFDPLMDALNSFSSVPNSCTKAVLFLTDGMSNSFLETYYSSIKSAAQSNNVIIFTYGLGDGADSSIISTIACQNDGIHYYVPDNGDLSLVMGSYYAYFVAANVTSKPTWIIYDDWITNSELVASCITMNKLSIQSSTFHQHELVGVVCMDLNMLADLNELKSTPSLNYNDFLDEITNDAESCDVLWAYIADKQEALEALRIKESNKGATRCHADNYFPNLAGYNPTSNNATEENNGLCAAADVSEDRKDENSLSSGITALIVVGVLFGSIIMFCVCSRSVAGGWCINIINLQRATGEWCRNIINLQRAQGGKIFTHVNAHEPPVPSAPAIHLGPGSDLQCPITMTIMEDPVICSDGFSYERSAIESWLRTNNTSPKTNEILPSKALNPNKTLKAAIISYNETGAM